MSPAIPRAADNLTGSTRRRKPHAAAQFMVGQVDTPEQLQELLRAVPRDPLIRGLCARTDEPSVSDKIVAHLASDAQIDPALKKRLSRSG